MVPRIAWVYVEFTEEVHLRQFSIILTKVESNVVFAKNYQTNLQSTIPLKQHLLTSKLQLKSAHWWPSLPPTR